MIRKATLRDIEAIHRLLHAYSHQGDLVPRSLSDLYGSIRDFSVVEDSETGRVIGCCALQFCWEDLAEIRSLVIDEPWRGKEWASRLVAFCVEEARRHGMAQLFCLTFKPDFFEKFGFHRIDRSELPLKIWADCMHCVKFPDCDGIAMKMTLK